MTPQGPLDRLRREPRRFRFDAAVRLLMLAARRADPAQVARFRSPTDLGYPPADVLQVRAGEGSGPPSVVVGAIGLTGPSGVLPRYYTEVLAATLRDRSQALHDFIDLLAHRLVAQFAQAGAKYRPARTAETARMDPRGGADPVGGALLALTGYGTPHLTPRMAAGADPLQHYAGLFALRPRSAARLRALASDWLGRPVEVQEFAGAWLSLPVDQRSRLPSRRRAGGFNRLGVDAAVGVRAWDVQARIVLRVGPLDRAGFEALLPDRPALGRFVALLRAYLGFETGFAINLVLDRDAVPPVRLDAAATPPPRLGWNTWLPAASRRRQDAAEALFEAEVVEAAAARAPP